MFRSQRLVLGLLLLALVLAQSAQAWPEASFIPVFDGSDLTGWRSGKNILHKASDSPEGRFSVAGKTLVINSRDKDGKKDTREILSVREFSRDFVLRLEFKAAQEATAVVLVRNTPIPVGDFIRRNEQKQLKKFQTDGWNELEITVKMAAHVEGKRLKDTDHLEASFQNGKAQAKVNGKTVDPNRVVIQVEGYPRINGEPLQARTYGLASKGPIGLRSGSGKVEFRNIRFHELP